MNATPVEMGRTGYQPVAVGNLPTAMKGARCRRELRVARVASFRRAGSPAERAGCPCYPRAQLLVWICITACLIGCGKNAADQAGDSDVNSYLCRKCSLKFYTDRKVFAEHCPSCKSFEIPPVIGFVCDKDGHTTLVARGPESVACGKCQSPATAKKLPRES